MKKIKLALIGASGLVGQTFLEILKEQDFLKFVDLTLFVSNKTAGSQIIVDGKVYPLILLTKEKIKNDFDIAVFSAGDDVSLDFVKLFASNGTFVIDNSNAFRRENEIPLVVPEININEINENTKIISNPNCSTIELVIVLDKFAKLSKIRNVVVSTYQSVSGAGKEALNDLYHGDSNVIKEGISNNLIPYIGNFEKFGYSVEEDKIMFESKKILKNDFNIFASSVRVPVSHCHLESVYVEFNDNVDVHEIKKYFDDDSVIYSDEIVTPKMSKNQNVTFVFRVRQCTMKSITFFVLADNLRRGAAYNAFLIAKHIAKNYLEFD